MIGYPVDTNVSSELTRQRPDPRVEQFLDRCSKLSLLEPFDNREAIEGDRPSSSRTERDSLQEWLNRDVRAWFAGRLTTRNDKHFTNIGVTVVNRWR